MKIYFTYTKTLQPSITNRITEYLTTAGHKVSSRQRMEDYGTVSFENARTAFNLNVKNIKNCDVILAEVSYSSSGLGYEISLALEEKKPVIAIYNMTEDLNHPKHIPSVPTSLKGNTSKYLLLREYDLKNLEKILELAMKDTKDLVDTKFILIIPPEIDKYLEWNARERNKAKAEVTREAIEKIMLEDEKYQEYLKQTKEQE